MTHYPFKWYCLHPNSTQYLKWADLDILGLQFGNLPALRFIILPHFISEINNFTIRQKNVLLKKILHIQRKVSWKKQQHYNIQMRTWFTSLQNLHPVSSKKKGQQWLLDFIHSHIFLNKIK